MEAKLIKLLEKYRNSDDPELKPTDGKCLSTFSKEELMDKLKKVEYRWIGIVQNWGHRQLSYKI